MYLLDAHESASNYSSACVQQARKVFLKSGSSHGPGAYPASVGPGGMGGNVNHNEIQNTRKQLQAAKRDTSWTAIRPIANKIAAQEFRVGKQRKATVGVPPVKNQKSKFPLSVKNLAPEFIRKRISRQAQRTGFELLDDHALYDWLDEPNKFMNRWALMWVTTVSIAATGKAYWFVEEGTDDLTGEERLFFWYLPPDWVTPIHTEQQAFAGWKIKTANGQFEEEVPFEKIIYFPFPDPENPTGTISLLQTQSRSINIDESILNAQLHSMHNAVRPGIAIVAGRMDQMPGTTGPGPKIRFTAEQRKQLINAIRMHYQGVMHSDEPFILDADIQDVKPVFSKPHELAFGEGSRLARGRIMQGTGVNPIVTGEIEGANRASAIVADTNFFGLVVNPIIALISASLTMHLAPQIADSGDKLFIWLDQAQARDHEAIRQRIQTAAKFPVMTRGEHRHFIMTGEVELEPRDDDEELVGDTRFYSGVGGKPDDLADMVGRIEMAEEAEASQEGNKGSEDDGSEGEEADDE